MKLKHYLYCLFVGFVHMVYTLVFPSLINGEKAIWSGHGVIEESYIHAFHMSRVMFGEFARRPVTTFLIEITERLGIAMDVGFLFVLYSGLLIALVLLFQLSFRLMNSAKVAYWSVAIFITSFWVIHAFFAEIYAYDEPWQYVFVFGSFLFLKDRKWIPFSVLFLLGMIARESTMLLLPGIFFFFMLDTPVWSRANLTRLLKVGWTVPAYGLFLAWLTSFLDIREDSSTYMRDIRFNHLYYSFADLDIGIDTLTSMAMSLAIAMLLLVFRKRFINSELDKPWIYAFALNFSINAFITLTLTMGRETRIFAQPILMLSPFLGYYLLEAKHGIGVPFKEALGSFKAGTKWFAVFLFVSALCFAISLFSYEVYWPTDTKFFWGFQHFVYLTFSMVALLLLLTEFSQPIVNPTWRQRLPSLLLFLPVLLFFGNQSGFRSFETYEPVEEAIIELNTTGRDHYVLISSGIPNVAESYFESRGLDVLAGDFNLKLPIRQFFYNASELENKNAVFLELEPSIQYPMRYILSNYGRAREFELEEFENLLIVETDKDPLIEKNTYFYSLDSAAFSSKTSQQEKWAEAMTFNDEYSVSFKKTLQELNIDTLESIAAKVDFKCGPESKAMMIISVDVPNENGVWDYAYLGGYLIDMENWNTTYKANRFEKAISHPEAKISFYIWNPKKETISIRNPEITLNSHWLPPKKTRRSALSSRNLK